VGGGGQEAGWAVKGNAKGNAEGNANIFVTYQVKEFN
jgi:hypothetical protein